MSAIITVIKCYIDGHINKLVYREDNLCHHFQQPGESFDNFLVSVHELAKTCSFCSEQCTQKSIRDQFIEGSLDGDVTEELLKHSNLTLDNTIAIGRAREPAKRQRNEIASTSRAVFGQSNYNSNRLPPTTQQPFACPRCGSKPHVGGYACCPTYEQI